MTIEDSLEKIELKKDKINSLSDIESQDNPPQTELIKQAQEYLGDYLTSGIFNISLEENLKSFVQNFGPFMFTFKPKGLSSNQGSSQKQACTLVNHLEKELLDACLSRISNGYLLKTDLANTNGADLENDFYKYIPELNQIKEIFCKDFGSYITSINPYAIVMGMEPKNRPLMAVVIGEATTNKKIKIPAQNKIDDNRRKETILSLAPSLELVAETAQKYNITNIKEIIKDFNKAAQAYKDAW